MKSDTPIEDLPGISKARKRGAVCIAIALCVAFALPTATAVAGERSGKAVVDSTCVQCHATGKDGAPRIGDGRAWSYRASQGLTSLTRHAIDGIRNMPAHGGDADLSDLEIARAVTYMVNRSGGNWVEPASAADLAKERRGEQVVKAYCVNCHGEGVGGAPKVGDRNAWVQRLNQGVDYMVRSAIRGHGGMPPRGGEASLTDSELRAAVLYMYNPAAGPAKPAKSMPFNAKIYPHLMALGDDVKPQLAWDAATPDEHKAWARKARAKVRQLAGKMPQRVPLEIKWGEKKEFAKFVRQKIYVRSETHYWAPAFYFVPKGADPKAKRPAIVCLHGS